MSSAILASEFIFVLANALSYSFFFKHRQPFRTERGIFIFQAASFLLLVGCTVALPIFGRPLHEAYLLALAAVGIHGIYSLSFLELWSLTEGSYSLSVLLFLDRNRGEAEITELESLTSIAAHKTESRIDGLVRIGLLRVVAPGRVSRTAFGTAVACVFGLVVFLTNGRPLNR